MPSKPSNAADGSGTKLTLSMVTELLPALAPLFQLVEKLVTKSPCEAPVRIPLETGAPALENA